MKLLIYIILIIMIQGCTINLDKIVDPYNRINETESFTLYYTDTTDEYMKGCLQGIARFRLTYNMHGDLHVAMNKEICRNMVKELRNIENKKRNENGI